MPKDLTHELVLVAYDGIQALDLTGPHEVFAAANRVADAFGSKGTRYRIRIVGPTGTRVSTESGLCLSVDEPPSPMGPVDTLLIAGGDSALELDSIGDLVDWVARTGPSVRRLACVCTGVFVAAEAGLLDGYRVATHWARVGALASRFPELTVDPDAIYLEDRDVWSSAGVTAGIDLALALVERDMGVDIAQEVARWLVVFLRRPGGQSQFAPAVWERRSPEGPIRQAQDLIDADPSAVGSVADLAAAVGFSPRHFTRRFTAEAGVTPAKYLERVRVSAARNHLESGTEGMAAIARLCGFGSAETLRQVFHRQLGVSPDDYRRRFTQVSTDQPQPTPAN